MPDEAGCSDGNDPFAVQTGYDLLVSVKPNDENTVFIGGTNLYRSTSGFTNTTATTRIGGYNSPASYALYPNHHPDQHIVVFAAGDNTTIYSGNDGGIQKADATAATVVWTSLNNNYVTYQYYNTDIDPANGSTALLGGAQDNGTTTVQTGSDFSSVFGGDGCGVGIMSYTSATSFNILASSQSGNIVRLTSPGFGFGIRPSGLVGSAFVTNFNLDQDNRNYLYFAGLAVLYRTRIAQTISSGAVSGSATGWEIVPAGISGNIQSMSASRNDTYGGAAYTASNPNRKLYIGTTTGKVFRLNDPAFTTTAAVEITPITPIAASGVCSSIAVNPYDDKEIIVTFSNYAVRSVYHTLDASVAVPVWTVIEGPATGPVALGSARASIITKIGSTKTYLVGTSTGLYSTQTLSGATTVWDRVGTNEINYALAANMRLRTSDNRIVLGTHGNGMFELQLATAVNISSQPMAVTACAGSDVSFSVVATGITAYKWQVSPDSNPANFVDITIAAPYSTTNSGATLNITAITAGLNGMYYRCVLTDASSIATNSNSALLTVANPVTPTDVLTNNTSICVGGSVSLSATCSVGTVTWYDVATAGTSIGTGSPLVQNPTVNNTTYYASCKAGSCESSRIPTSAIAIITSVSPTGVTADLAEVCVGSSVSLSATCSDAGAVVNWYTQASGGVAIGTGSPFSNSPTASTTYYASCKVTPCESNRVATALVNVLPNLNAPINTTQVNLAGTINTSSPIYNRPNVFTVGSGVCALASDGVVFNYKTHTFTLNTASIVVASLLTADGGSITPGGADTFLTLYSTFDPLNPCTGIVGINDDFSSSVFLSKITTASLPAGTYTAVLSSFDPGTAANLPWAYSIAIKTTAAALVVGSPPTMIKVNNVTTPVNVYDGVGVVLSATCNDGTVTWYNEMTGGTALGTGSPINACANASKSYYVSCKNSCSETARVATALITLTQNVNASIPASVCEGGIASLSATCVAGTVTWYTSATGGIGTTGSTFTTTALSSNTSYYVACETNGCAGTRTQVNVTVNAAVNYLYVKAGNPYQELFPLVNGMLISQIPQQVSILATPACIATPIESFEMNIQGPSGLNWNTVQNVGPFALFDNAALNIWGRDFIPGNYSLTVTGYSLDNKGGSLLYGPRITNFTVVGGTGTIVNTTASSSDICAGSTVNVSFAIIGSFNAGNIFNIQLSDANGNFINPTVIGTTNAAGIIPCTIPMNTTAGNNYQIRVVASDYALAGNPTVSVLTINPLVRTMISPVDDIAGGTSINKAINTINATNKVLAPANTTYQAGNSILLSPGFNVNSGAVFKAQILGCN